MVQDGTQRGTRDSGTEQNVWIRCAVASIRHRRDVSIMIDVDGGTPNGVIPILAPRNHVRLLEQVLASPGEDIVALVRGRLLKEAGSDVYVELIDQGTPVRHLIPKAVVAP